MKLSEIDRTLREIRVTPVKTLGQNFLHDQNLARWVVQQAELAAGDFVLEIGPGLGALTAPALDAGTRVLAIEKDARLANFLRLQFAGRALEIVHGDALEFEVAQLFPRGPVKLLGNLPYYISTPLLLRFLQTPTPITLAVLMLQKEVAVRLSAGPRSRDYGVLSLVVQSQCRVEFLRTVPASVFLPQPEVDSAFVRLRPRAPNELPPHDRGRLLALVRRGFSQRRKQLGKLLKDEVADWPRAAAEIGASSQARAEELSLEQWIALANFGQPVAAEKEGTNAAEAFATVDQFDRVLGSAPRSEVHGNNLRHRAVHIFLVNDAGELLLQKRSPWKDRHPLLWDSSAAGHVRAGEGYDATAGRELREELGVTAELNLVGKLPASEETGQEFIQLYRGRHEGPFEVARAEIDAIEFFAPEVIARWIGERPGDFAPGFLACWRLHQSGVERAS
ncbi:MAG TPA: 16S rRNA (adenine(1518)-N(6)/adenine(1519)-N(6))-dimethyltransferase RsmA [Chthoniobacterales bacterium]|nr:16S rRNA (adenine(1518)-N(6)/adenine(1519)-N(6))-dimethyltransferase RsmA [Chthoniobacterales bacterium]